MCEAPLIVSLNRHWLSSSGKSDESSQTNNEKPTATHWLINLKSYDPFVVLFFIYIINKCGITSIYHDYCTLNSIFTSLAD